MTNARGDNTQILARIQAAFGTAEAATEGGYRLLPIYSFNPVPSEDLSKDDLILGDHFGGDTVEGLRNVSGSMVVPLGMSSIGWHLAMLLGDPTTVGAGDPYTHTFKPAAQPTPRLQTFDKGHKDVGEFFRQDSVLYTGFSLNARKEGQRARMSIDVMAREETPAGAALDSTPVEYASDLVPVGFKGKAKIDGADFGSLTSFNAQVTSSAEADQEIMNGLSTAAGYDLGDWDATGSAGLRFRDRTIYDAARAGTLVDLSLEYVLSGSRSIIFNFYKVRFEPTGVPIGGRGVSSVDFNWQVGRPDAGDVPFDIVLKNGVADYANPA